MSPTLAPKVAVACAIMHNVCIMAGDEWEDEASDNSDGEIQVVPHQEFPEQSSAVALRQQIAAQISQPALLVNQLFDHDYC